MKSKIFVIVWMLFAFEGFAMSAYENEILEWRKVQEQNLKGGDGWLTVVGLHWLKEGDNLVGSKFGTPVLLPKSVPPELGVIKLTKEKVFLKLKQAEGVQINSQKADVSKEYELLTDKENEPTIVQLNSVKFFIISRPNGFGVRVKDSEAEARKKFTGRKWYPVNDKLKIEADWVEFKPAKKIIVPDILGNMNSEEAPGEAAFEIQGKRVTLTPTLDGKRLFFVFKDLTAPKETYGAARFLSAALPQNGKVILDFNKAVNPPCAFTDYATCPFPPDENKLQVRIEAGELKTH